MQQTPGQMQQQTQQPAPGAGQGPGGRGAAGGAPRVPRPEVPQEFDALPIWKLDEAKLIAMVKDPTATVFQKAIACKRLSMIGGKAAILPMAALLGHPQISGYARFGMEPNPDPSVDEQFRLALGKLKGPQLVGVIHSIGVRRDQKALDAVGKFINDSDPQLAQAACATVGMIGGVGAMRLLQPVLANPKHSAFGVAARASLICAEGLMTTAVNKPRALELYATLAGIPMPEPVRMAALRVLNANGPAPAGAKAYPPPETEPEPAGRGAGRGEPPAGGQPPAGGRGPGGAPNR
jgi:hypothetical protein